MKKQQVQEESGGEKAPLWYISFADMISLLMAFFVMLQTMATTRSNEFLTGGNGPFEATAGAFRRTIDGFGLPGLFGKLPADTDFGNPRRYYRFKSPDKSSVQNPAADTAEEKARRLFSRLADVSKTYPSQIRGEMPEFVITPIVFAPQSDELNPEAQSYLSQFVAGIQQTRAVSGELTIYIVGIAADVSDGPQQWIVSERRARAAAERIRSALPEAVRGQVYWWGAGAGGAWTAKGPATEHSQLLIAMLNKSSSER